MGMVAARHLCLFVFFTNQSEELVVILFPPPITATFYSFAFLFSFIGIRECFAFAAIKK
jgi:hypothetical protein